MFLQYCSIKRNQPPNIFSLHRKKYFIISSETSPKFGKFEVLQFYVIYSGDKTWLDEKKKVEYQRFSSETLCDHIWLPLLSLIPQA